MTPKLFGFWRSLATCRVRIALAFKGMETEEVSINLLQGQQHGAEYRAVNPQSLVPALVIDDGPPLFQSMAILEYLEETHPQPPLLPPDPRGRARVRGLAQIVAADSHPLIVPRIRTYLEKELRTRPGALLGRHWILKRSRSRRILSGGTGRFCHGDTPACRHLPRRRYSGRSFQLRAGRASGDAGFGNV
jgi:maleylacetoacetate isomerase